jgi:hypothetical protein
MAVLRYNDRTLDVLSCKDFLETLLYSEGYDVKNKVSHHLDILPTVDGSDGVNFVKEFYEEHGERPDMLVVDFGDDRYMPTYLSSWSIEQYRDLDGSPYLGLKQAASISHLVYFLQEKAAAPDTWDAKEDFKDTEYYWNTTSTKDFNNLYYNTEEDND